MEWSWQTVLIILGLISIGLILFDGYRKMQRSRAEALRLNVNNSLNSGDSDEYNPELPGEVRVVTSHSNTEKVEEFKRSEPSLKTTDSSERFNALEEQDADDSLLFDGYETKANDEPESQPNQKVDQEEDCNEIVDSPVIPVAKPVDLDEDVPVLLDVEELGSEDNFAKTKTAPLVEPLESESTPLETDSIEEEPVVDQLVEQPVESESQEEISTDSEELNDPHLEEEVEEMPEEGSLTDLVNYAAPDAETLASRPEPQMVMVIHLIARDEEGFDGKEILYLFNSCDLRYGEKEIFHRFEETDGKGCIQFSIAQTCNPGTFEPKTMSETRFPGLSFFLSLPGAKRPLEAYTAMAEMAMAVSRNLNADILDGTHSAMTPQTIEHERQQIMDYERKQRLAAKKRSR